MTTRSIPARLGRIALVLLAALSWGGLAFCGEIHDAAQNGDLEKVKALLKDNPDLVFSKDSYGKTALHWAAIKGNKDLAELLLVKRAAVNAKDGDGSTPLHDAATMGRTELVKLLLASNAEVNAKSNVGLTPLYNAALHNHKDIVEALLARKADYNILDAAAGGDLERARALVKDNPGLVFSLDGEGNTPLHDAAAGGRKEVVEFLLANKAGVDVKNTNGFTALHWAATNGRKEVVALLVAKHANVNAKDNLGRTPLRLATIMRQRDVAEFLRQHGGHE